MDSYIYLINFTLKANYLEDRQKVTDCAREGRTVTWYADTVTTFYPLWCREVGSLEWKLF